MINFPNFDESLQSHGRKWKTKKRKSKETRYIRSNPVHLVSFKFAYFFLALVHSVYLAVLTIGERGLLATASPQGREHIHLCLARCVITTSVVVAVCRRSSFHCRVQGATTADKSALPRFTILLESYWQLQSSSIVYSVGWRMQVDIFSHFLLRPTESDSSIHPSEFRIEGDVIFVSRNVKCIGRR